MSVRREGGTVTHRAGKRLRGQMVVMREQVKTAAIAALIGLVLGAIGGGILYVVLYLVLSQPPVMIIGFGMAILAILSGGLALARSWVGHHDTRTMSSASKVVGAAAIIGLVPGVFGGMVLLLFRAFASPQGFFSMGSVWFVALWMVVGAAVSAIMVVARYEGYRI